MVVIKALGAFIVVIAVLYGTALALGYGSLPILNIQRQMTQQSLPYVQSKQKEMLDLVAQYNRLEVQATQYEGASDAVQAIRAQQRAIVNSIRQDIGLIAQDAVPPEVRAFMSQRGGN